MNGSRNSDSSARRQRGATGDDGGQQPLDGDIGLAVLNPSQQRRERPARLSFDLPELELPAPALPTPDSAYPSRPITDAQRRELAHATAITERDYVNAPPPITPLRPILNPKPRESIDLGPIKKTTSRVLPRTGSISPTFAPRDDDEPHPEHGRNDDRVLHPLYTPARTRRHRTRSRKARSVNSGRSGRSSRSGKLRGVLKMFKRRKGDKRKSSRLSLAPTLTASSRSSSSSSSSTTSSSGRSSRSSSTWAGWRFWRNSSSGSSTSDRQGSDDEDDDSEEAPQTVFTLLTPYLGQQQDALAYPEHLLPRNEGLTPAPAAGLSKQKVFDLTTTLEISPALERLQLFWKERKQEDGIAGDLGASAMPARHDGASDDDAEDSYFPQVAADGTLQPPKAATSLPLHLRPAAASLAPTPVGTPVGDKPVLDASRSSARVLRGAERALRAEQRRLGNKDNEETGPAWWLDVMCPSIADLKELRKLLPLHPLTMEDIMHQETREKIEAFPALGYYFIIFRAIDESYFRYTSPENVSNPTVEQMTAHNNDDASSDRAKSVRESTMNGAVPSRAGRVEIVEGVGGKEGIEGVGVGAINMYLIVFDDGILSFHFEELSKHIEHVQGRLQSFGAAQRISSHWIAYSLMDSVVDAFFPLINFIETESEELGKFLADPLRDPKARTKKPKVAPSGIGQVGDQRVYDSDVVGIMVDPSSVSSDINEKDRLPDITVATVKRSSRSAVLRGLPFLTVPSALKRAMPKNLLRRKVKISESSMMVNRDGIMVPKDPSKEARGYDPRDLFRPEMILIADTTSDRAALLKRIVDSRKLVTALSRLLWSKTDVVRGLRKRTKEDHIRLFRGSTKYDIGVYLGDLTDHIVAMQQSLHFYDAILANDHPAYAGLLRLSSRSAKHEIDKTLVKLSMTTVTFLVMNVLPGVFTLNVQQPTNGARGTHLRADGTIAPFYLFGILISAVSFLAMLAWTYFWLAFRTARRSRSSLKHA